MNKAITEGLSLMPPAFIDGLDVWSSGNGTIGTPTYDSDPSGTLFAADQDFGDCLEIVTATTPQLVRYTGETPIIPGCYLEVSARVKLISGAIFPQVRIGAYAGDANGDQVTGLDTNGDAIQLEDFSRVYTVRAIIGSGARTGVDLQWGLNPVFAHVGIDILGDPGVVVRVESIQVTDKTSVFHRKLMDWVDVRDYGAVGDGIANDAAAFEAADAAADGRSIIVPEGTFFLNKNVTITAPMRFEGTVTMPDDKRLVLRANYDFPTYADAFGNEELGLKKAIQALFNSADHTDLDLKGRQVELSGPIDVFETVGNVSLFAERRSIKNGQLVALDTPAWDNEVVTSSASYDGSNGLILSNVTNIGAVPVGALIQGNGVGREVYVRAKDEATGELTLSQALYNASATQTYTFTRYKYMLDFSGFTRITQFNIDGVQFLGEKRASAVLLPIRGIWWIIRNCWFTRTARGVTSIGDCCQGITIDQCEFLAPDSSELVQTRTSVGFNVNRNDAKIRDNRCIDYQHFGVLSGNGNIIVGNHFWQLDAPDQGERTAGLIFTDKRSKTTITGNYIDNQFIEFSNEHAADAVDGSGTAFGRVTITGNIFTGTRLQPWFRFIVWTPYGTDHFLDGVAITGNTFQLFGGSVIDRVEAVDTTNGTFDFTKTTAVVFDGNGYGEVTTETQSPALIEVNQGSNASVWQVSTDGRLPFGGFALGAEGLTAYEGFGGYSGYPQITPQQGGSGQRVDINWGSNVSGRVQLRVRVDRPAP